MYGLLLNSMFQVFREVVGNDDVWNEMKVRAGVNAECPLEPLSINSDHWVTRLLELIEEETGLAADAVIIFDKTN